MRLILLGLATVIVVGSSTACRRVEELNRARGQANEATAIANLRIVLSAEAAYSSANSGAYGSMECLADPAACVAGNPGDPLLEKGFLSGERNGYVYEFHVGGDSPQAAGRPPGSSLSSYAIVASPAMPGSSGNRRFCGDSSMNVCAMLGDAAISGGQCPSSCEPLP